MISDFAACPFFVNSKLDLFKKEDNLAIVDNDEYDCIF